MIHWNVPVLGQTSPATCWEAVGHMMWLWRYLGDEDGYRRKAGDYLRIMHGLGVADTGIFYRSLGMLEGKNADSSFFAHHIHLHPMIVLVGLGDDLHAEALVGRTGSNYVLNNPQAQAILTFGDNGVDVADVPQVGGTGTAPVANFSSPRVWWWPRHSS